MGSFSGPAQRRLDEPAGAGNGESAFAARFPLLFHVTSAEALPLIRAHGLLSAERLCAVVGLPEVEAAALLGANRRGWVTVSGPGGTAWLRLQGMGDGPLASRLCAGLTPEAFRRHVNGQVHLWAAARDAARLRAFHRERPQVVLRFATGALLAAGCALAFCRFNNGYVDRGPEGRRRLRGLQDYRPIAAWRPGEKVREVVIRGGVPARVGFEVAG
jgi:hypothetical protein